MGNDQFWGGGEDPDNQRERLLRESAERRAAAAAAEAQRLAGIKAESDAKAAAEAKVAKDIADKKAWDLKIGKTRKKSAGGSARTDYHTGLGETEQASIASKSLLGQ